MISPQGIFKKSEKKSNGSTKFATMWKTKKQFDLDTINILPEGRTRRSRRGAARGRSAPKKNGECKFWWLPPFAKDNSTTLTPISEFATKDKRTTTKSSGFSHKEAKEYKRKDTRVEEEESEEEESEEENSEDEGNSEEELVAENTSKCLSWRCLDTGWGTNFDQGLREIWTSQKLYDYTSPKIQVSSQAHVRRFER